MAATKKKLGPGRHLSAIKRHRQSLRRAKQNRVERSTVKTLVKQLRQAIEKGDPAAAQTLFVKTQSRIARAIKHGLFHPRTGQRKISRLHRRLSRLGS